MLFTSHVVLLKELQQFSRGAAGVIVLLVHALVKVDSKRIKASCCHRDSYLWSFHCRLHKACGIVEAFGRSNAAKMLLETRLLCCKVEIGPEPTAKLLPELRLLRGRLVEDTTAPKFLVRSFGAHTTESERRWPGFQAVRPWPVLAPPVLLPLDWMNTPAMVIKLEETEGEGYEAVFDC